MNKEIIQNPITGETLYVLESTKDVFRFEFAIEPGCEIAAEHVHPNQQQNIYVTEGALGCRIDGVEQILLAGEGAIVPPGASHFQWNPGDGVAWAIEEHRPAGKAHNFFRVAFALARDGHTNEKGIAKPLIGAALLSELKGFVRPTSIGLRILFGVLAPLSALLGYRRLIRQYIEQFERQDMHRTPVVAFADTPAAKHAASGQTI